VVQVETITKTIRLFIPVVLQVSCPVTLLRQLLSETVKTEVMFWLSQVRKGRYRLI